MEKENKEVIENAEQKENNTEKKEQSEKKDNKKKILFITFGIVLALCLGIFIFIRINTTEKHVYEEVENLGEREGVCFDNLLLSCTIGLYDDGTWYGEWRYLCIFNTGDVYCFEWSGLDPWSAYYDGDKEHDYKVGYDETNWKKMYNVIYLGKLSNWDTIRLNQYIQSYDIESEYYSIWDTYPMLIPVGSGENRQNTELIEGGIWRSYMVEIYRDEQDKNRKIIIESSDMNYLGNGIYEKGELRMKAYDENAIAALELFESSGFYDRWVAMCLNNG